MLKKILLSLTKPLQDIFALTDGYSVSSKQAIDNLTSKCSLELLSSLQAEDFKKVCAEYFAEKNYRAKENIQVDGICVDIGLFKQSYSDSKPFGIIKCWPTKAIPVKHDDINQFKAMLVDKQISFGAFITAGKFLQENHKSDDKRLQLIDGEKLLSLIQALPEIRKKRLLSKISSMK